MVAVNVNTQNMFSDLFDVVVTVQSRLDMSKPTHTTIPAHITRRIRSAHLARASRRCRVIKGKVLENW